MSKRNNWTAANIVNDYPAKKLRDIFYQYGDLKNSSRISMLLENARVKNPIQTTSQLKEVLAPAAPRNAENKFFAKVFQALRIEVNDELGALKDFLEQTTDMIKPGGRLVVISYHSLEDRLVKNFIKSGNFKGEVKKDFYGNVEADFKQTTRKPIIPKDEEIEKNNRARSAKLRIAEKL
jgi:16S rRNA (cytosine1402-N4)-methyltransferase